MLPGQYIESCSDAPIGWGRLHRAVAPNRINRTAVIRISDIYSYIQYLKCVGIYSERLILSIDHLYKKVSTDTLHPRPVLSHCPLSCLTFELHAFLMADTVTVGIVYWPRCTIFSAQLSRRGGEVAAGRNMTLMCQSQRARLAQRLSILRRDQQFCCFFFPKTARSLCTRNHCGRRAALPVQEAQDKSRRDAIGPVSISPFLCEFWSVASEMGWWKGQKKKKKKACQRCFYTNWEMEIHLLNKWWSSTQQTHNSCSTLTFTLLLVSTINRFGYCSDDTDEETKMYLDLTLI